MANKLITVIPTTLHIVSFIDTSLFVVQPASHALLVLLGVCLSNSVQYCHLEIIKDESSQTRQIACMKEEKNYNDWQGCSVLQHHQDLRLFGLFQSHHDRLRCLNHSVLPNCPLQSCELAPSLLMCDIKPSNTGPKLIWVVITKLL